MQARISGSGKTQYLEMGTGVVEDPGVKWEDLQATVEVLCVYSTHAKVHLGPALVLASEQGCIYLESNSNR